MIDSETLAGIVGLTLLPPDANGYQQSTEPFKLRRGNRHSESRNFTACVERGGSVINGVNVDALVFIEDWFDKR